MNPIMWLKGARSMLAALMSKPGGAAAVKEGLASAGVTTLAAFKAMWTKSAGLVSAAASGVAVDKLRAFFGNALVQTVGGSLAIEWAIKHMAWDTGFIAYVKHLAGGGQPTVVDLPVPPAITAGDAALSPDATLPQFAGQMPASAPAVYPAGTFPLSPGLAATSDALAIKARINAVRRLVNIAGSADRVMPLLEALRSVSAADVELYKTLNQEG